MKISSGSRWIFILTGIGVAIAIAMITYITFFDPETAVIHIP